MSIAAKMYINRFVPFVKDLLRKNQNGFRRECSTSNQILCERRSKPFNRDLAIKVFNSKEMDKVLKS